MRKLGRLVAVAALVLFTALFATACVTANLTPGGEKVRVTSNPEAVHGCTLIGEVEGTSRLGGLAAQSAGHNNAIRGLKNHAAAMGADTVLMVTSTTNFSGSRQLGEAYRCCAVPPPR